MENRESIIKKIENLLALAGNNPNEHEAYQTGKREGKSTFYARTIESQAS